MMIDANFLIVDDILMNRMLLKEFLGSTCNNIMEASNGKDAIEILKKEKIDIVFMDIEMPVMNGVETTKFIRDEMPYPLNKIPIIALTAYNPDDFFDSYDNAGFDYLLTKPYSLDKILNTINILLNNNILKKK